ncbi:tetratricopeptide repeat protein [Actinophytocola algeriensis]|uniref:Tetratricopeptide (TPR) repeat protein n=1 Tax=Actinophytocola algeriensis TaxID=1768010 RepID=A0A7W7VI30_9PSEU|nr:tetratricopeptide repeat protein [Actinophytocola algeriensis]MBB4910859.1 tetratricopeptide (TPR) repeat protein [Actinophytocola algeriensis]MBE1473852.1 tetratricopeptide (TPR) repeat protein [Actinophytocola algeriensis]
MKEYGPFDCDAWAGGPYAGAGEFLEVVVAELLGRAPELVDRHAVELVSAVPGLAPVLPASAAAALDESADVQIRFHPAARTRALAFGLAELVRAWAAVEPATVAFANTDRADGTVVELLDALRPVPGLTLTLGRTSPAEPDQDPAELRATLGFSIARGFYDHGRRVASHGRDRTTPATDLGLWWAFTTGLATCLTALGEPAAARDLYLAAVAATDDPAIVMSASASLGVLHTRHLPADPATARDWLERAMALAAELPEPRRTVLSVFHGQGLALLDSKAGDHDRALRTIDDGLAALDRVLAEGERRQDRARLLHNRAQVHLALRRPAAALADLDAVIALDPYNAEYYTDRASLLRAEGRVEEAIADCTAAIRWHPHLPEAYYNRADLLQSTGEPDAALADLDCVLAQEPAHVDALTNRAALRYEQGDVDGAETDARAGLAAAPGDPHLLCALGLVHAERGDLATAADLFTQALEARPDLTEALVNRATTHFDRGDIPSAVDDLTAALAVTDDPVTRYNRGHAHRELGDWQSAAADFTAALSLDDGADTDFTTELHAAIAECTTHA